MICQSIMGSNSGKEKIMVVDIHANFIQPLLEFSERNLSFVVVKVSFSLVTRCSERRIQSLSNPLFNIDEVGGMAVKVLL